MGHQRLPLTLLLKDDGALGHTRDRVHGLLDVLQLDPVAVQFHLVVHTSDQFERPVRAQPGHVSRPVDGAFGGQRGTRRKPPSGELLVAHVPVGDPRAADDQFAVHADRHRVELLVGDVHGRVGQRAADEHLVGVCGHLPAGGPYGGFRGPVHVEHPGDAQRLEPTRQREVEGLATHHECGQGAQGLLGPGQAEDGAQQRRGRLQGGDPRVQDEFGDRDGRIARGVRCRLPHRLQVLRHDHGDAPGQGPQQLHHRDVEGGGGDGEPHGVVGRPDRLVQRDEEVGKVRVGDLHALGLSGGARGEDGVGGLAGHRRRCTIGCGEQLLCVQTQAPAGKVPLPVGVVDDECHAVRRPDHALQTAVGRGAVQRHVDEPRRHDAQERHHQLR